MNYEDDLIMKDEKLSARLTDLTLRYALDVDGDFIIMKNTVTNKMVTVYIDELLICNSKDADGIITDDDGTLNIVTWNGCKELFDMIDNGSLELINRGTF